MSKSFLLDIVTAEGEVFSGVVQKLFVTGVLGEMEILSGHAPLLATLAPGPVWAKREDGTEDAFVILGGMLEVQPDVVIILGDSAIRAQNCDEAAAKQAIENIESRIARKEDSLDYSKAHTELAFAIAQLRVLKKLRKKAK